MIKFTLVLVTIHATLVKLPKKKKLFDSTVIPVINLSTEALFQDLNKYAKINYMQLTLVRGMLMI